MRFFHLYHMIAMATLPLWAMATLTLWIFLYISASNDLKFGKRVEIRVLKLKVYKIIEIFIFFFTNFLFLCLFLKNLTRYQQSLYCFVYHKHVNFHRNQSRSF